MAAVARTLPLLLVLAACGGDGEPSGEWRRDDAELALSVRTAAPGRAAVESYVLSTATLEADRRVRLFAEIEGEVVEKRRELGDRVGVPPNGDDPLLLCRLDDRELAFEEREAEITHEEKVERIRELELARQEAEEEVAQAKVALEEAQKVLARTTVGLEDGTISREEHESAQFAERLARKKLDGAKAKLEKAKVSLALGRIAVEQAKVAWERKTHERTKALVRAPFPGVVTVCEVKEGQPVKKGDLLYAVADPASLVIRARIPVREAIRVRAGNPVLVTSTAAPDATRGEVVLVAPTVDSEAGTVEVKIRVEPAPEFRPGLYVALRIVVDRKEDAMVVPKRAILHDEEEGPYLFVAKGERAERTPVRLGYEKAGVVEILEGIDPLARVVVEGQDTLTDGARIDDLASPRPDRAEGDGAGGRAGG